jgi:hypothetical protein
VEAFFKCYEQGMYSITAIADKLRSDKGSYSTPIMGLSPLTKPDGSFDGTFRGKFKNDRDYTLIVSGEKPSLCMPHPVIGPAEVMT